MVTVKNKQHYLGVKEVLAEPMTKLQYCNYRDWVVPSNEDPNQEGYLIEYLDTKGNPNDSRHEGYITWTPKEAFDNAYRPTSGMNIGLAMEAIEKGKAVARDSWGYSYGREKFIYHVSANSYPAQTQVAKAVFGENLVPYQAYIAVKLADNVSIWTPTQEDLLATDFYIIENL